MSHFQSVVTYLDGISMTFRVSEELKPSRRKLSRSLSRSLRTLRRPSLAAERNEVADDLLLQNRVAERKVRVGPGSPVSPSGHRPCDGVGGLICPRPGVLASEPLVSQAREEGRGSSGRREGS